MPDLLTPPADATPAEALAAAAAAEAAKSVVEEKTGDIMDDATEKLYGGDGKPTADEKSVETPEEKAAREAAETPEQKAAREAEEAKAADERYGAPEGEYEAFVLPEGVELDKAGAADVVELAKELNLSQASAQKLIDKAVALRQRDAESLEAVHTTWIDQSKADKEFGGDKLNESLSVAQKALKEFGTAEFNELLTGARLGNHPEVIRFLFRVGTRVSEAPIVNGGRPVQQDVAKTLYPNLK